ncbi:hypothetical protein JZU56_02550, partial [bacterium]|nr:hypothetical protein [bacterium]
AESVCVAVSCALGQYVSGILCVDCSAGTYSDVIGATSCVACPAGAYSDVARASSASVCTTCPANSQSPISSSSVTSCTCNVGYPGPAGGPCTFSSACTPGNTRSGVACVPCSYGTFKATTGDEACTTCAAGQKANLGATACTGCVAIADV